MDRNKFKIGEDCLLFRELRGLSQDALADELGIQVATINRWESGHEDSSPLNLEIFYSYAYQSRVDLNRIKGQLLREEIGNTAELLFHGAKNSIDGQIRCDVSRGYNDFGNGFYMGESFRQASLFVSNFDTGSVYCLRFNGAGLKRVIYAVNTEWMMTVAYFRGKLNGLIRDEKAAELYSKVNDADYIIAPIADNRMYRIIDAFIDGEITDEQCRHALAATELGMQYVLKSSKAVSCVEPLEKCYLCIQEKQNCAKSRADDLKASEDKVRAARIKYRGKGKYIDELL